MAKLKIHIVRALTDNFVYALSNSQGDCAVIDPGDAAPILKYLESEKLNLALILCTHHHWDHTDGLAGLLAKFPVPVWASAVDSQKISHSTVHVAEGSDYPVLGANMRVIEVPGHTLGQVAFYFPEMEALFVGDTLFSCGCGRLFEGSYDQLFHSLKKIAALPPATEIFFGHEYTLRSIQFLRDQGSATPGLNEYAALCQSKVSAGQPTTPTTVARELELNPFLNATDVTVLKKWREARNVWR
jgi:hydroxyacylglutathione hydrolase